MFGKQFKKEHLPKWVSFFFCILFILASIPFLNADPDLNLCCYVDAFRMEGLATIQLRNYLNLGYLSLTESDMMLKQPLFNLILFLPLKFFGTHLSVARITVLLAAVVATYIFARLTFWKQVLPLFFIVVLFQYHLFQYAHYSMPELPAIGMILISIGFLVRALAHKTRQRRHIMLASLFSVLAFCTKQLYIDMLLMPPLTLLVLSFESSTGITKRDVLYSALWILIFAFAYLIIWYWPNREFYNHLTVRQTDMRYDWRDGFINIVWRNIRSSLLQHETRWYMLLSFLSFLVGVELWRKSVNSIFKTIFAAAVIVMILEMHKVTYDYFPPRYQAGIYFASGLIAVSVLCEILFSSSHSSKSRKVMAMILLCGFVLNNSWYYYGMYQRRQFAIQEVNQYMKATVNDPRSAVVGSWGPAITWESKSRSIPVVYQLMNDRNTLAIYKPVACILTEPLDPNSLNVFLQQGVNPSQISDSVRHFRIGRSDVNLFWLKQGH